MRKRHASCAKLSTRERWLKQSFPRVRNSHTVLSFGADTVPDVRDAMASNPLQHGAPRRFKVLVAGNNVHSDAKLHDIARYTDEGHFIHFAAFGIPGKPVMFNK